jgi:hypothetical protein
MFRAQDAHSLDVMIQLHALVNTPIGLAEQIIRSVCRTADALILCAASSYMVVRHVFLLSLRLGGEGLVGSTPGLSSRTNLHVSASGFGFNDLKHSNEY